MAQFLTCSHLTRLKRRLKVGPRDIDNRSLQQRQQQGNTPESGFAVFMVQQQYRRPRAGQRRQVQRFFGNTPLAPLGLPFIPGKEQETQQIAKQQATQA